MQHSRLIAFVGAGLVALGCGRGEPEILSPQLNQTSETTVTFYVLGTTFTASGGWTTDYARPSCSPFNVGWTDPDHEGLFCQAIAPIGGGTYMNGGQIQVNGDVGSASGFIGSIGGDLREDFTILDYPSGGTVTFEGQPANGSCTFDQWRVNGSANFNNPMTIAPSNGTEVVGWFYCS